VKKKNKNKNFSACFLFKEHPVFSACTVTFIPDLLQILIFVRSCFAAHRRWPSDQKTILYFLNPSLS